MSGTPETDAATAKYDYVLQYVDLLDYCQDMTKTSKELERKRNEALADLEFRRDLFRLQEKQLNEMRSERDELRAQLSSERALADRLAIELEPIAWSVIQERPTEAELAIAAWKSARSE